MTPRDPFIERDLAAIVSETLPWERLVDRHVLISGAAGFIGGHLVDTLAFLNEQTPGAKIGIHAMARDAQKLAARLPHLQGRQDFNPVIQDVVQPWKPRQQIDYIIHAASPASPAHYLAAPVDTIAANTLGTHNLLELAREHKARLLLLSSGTVYGQNASGKAEIAETDFGPLDPLDPRACYGESKRLAETLCAAYQRQHGVHTAIARISHTYGPGLSLDDGRVFTDFIADLLADRDIHIHSDGADSRPFCYITDLITGLYLVLLKGDAGEAYNVGATHETSVLELARLLLAISGKSHLRIRTRTGTQIPAAPRSSGHFDVSRIGRLGWSPRVEAEDGFRRMYTHLHSIHGQKQE